MNGWRKLLAVTLVAMPIFGSLTAHAKLQAVGTVEEVNVYAFGTPLDGNKSPKFVSDEVIRDEKLETVQNGGLMG